MVNSGRDILVNSGRKKFGKQQEENFGNRVKKILVNNGRVNFDKQLQENLCKQW